MFRKILIIAMFATAAGYCFAAENAPQIVTSEVLYTQNQPMFNGSKQKPVYEVPTWPMAGSDADVNVSCESGSAECSGLNKSDNIKIVSKIGADLVVENNFNMNANNNSASWSGGANMLHGSQVPAGFDDECNTQSEMPLMHREMLEDDGGEVLAVSRNSRKKCSGNKLSLNSVVTETTDEQSNEISVDQSADAEAPKELQDQVRSWVVASGQTLHEVLQDWCNKEGWDFVWATSREYPIEASAVFKGRFVDVSSALVRNFGRATPIPYAKFYKGNRVLVVSTTEE
ncbi:MAG: toxin co-regulated pilus biosynthesis Q family protein [Alphaproteobacteria bacterium]|nr:toxin co-regulated pilus biosynthesis Q family protein [Alphaproteobacteria bacterium]MBN2675170.1 toxin co-regulated pilus biosynthesis Q family protein [Alphaproteobacteria bacterium]